MKDNLKNINFFLFINFNLLINFFRLFTLTLTSKYVIIYIYEK